MFDEKCYELAGAFLEDEPASWMYVNQSHRLLHHPTLQFGELNLTLLFWAVGVGSRLRDAIRYLS